MDPVKTDRSNGLLILGVLDILFGALGFIAAIILLVVCVNSTAPFFMGFTFGLGVLFSLFLLLAGVGMATGKRWGAVMAIIYGSIDILRSLVLMVVWIIMVSKLQGLIGYAPKSVILLTVGTTIFGLVLPILNIVLGVGALRAKPSRAAGASIRPPLPKDLPSLDESGGNTVAPNFSSPKLSVQVFVYGQPVSEEVLNLRDPFGKPLKNSIGRDPDNTVIVAHDSVSAHHCVILEDKYGTVMVNDLQSLHGTRLRRGSKIIRVTKATAVFDKDILLMGPYVQMVLMIARPIDTKITLT